MSMDDEFEFSSIEPPTHTASPANMTAKQRREWDADKAMEALAAEARIFESTPVELAERLIEEALPLAVSSMVHLAKFGETEKMRYDAARYLIDRNLGTPNQIGSLRAKEGDPLDKLVSDCVVWEQSQGSK